MNPERTIQLTRMNADGQEEVVDVFMRYCVRTEVMFGELTNHEKDITVFNPQPITDEQGNTTFGIPKATDDDFVKLSLSAIIAAYEARDEDAPITVKDLYFHCTREQTQEMAKTIMMMRVDWLNIPKPVGDKLRAANKEKGKKRKNAMSEESQRLSLAGGQGRVLQAEGIASAKAPRPKTVRWA